MRGVVATFVLLGLVPVASGALTATFEPTNGTTPLDGSAHVTVALAIDCRDVDARPSFDDLAIDLSLAAPGLNLTGPASIAAARGACTGDPLGAWTGTASWHPTGDRYLPGLVPIPVSGQASLRPHEADTLQPVDPAAVTGLITPDAVLDYGFAPVAYPETEGARLTVPLTFVSRSNVELALGASVVPTGDTRGGLTLRADERVPRALDEVRVGKASLVATYVAPANGTGIDRFVVRVQPAVVRGPGIPAQAATVELAFLYHTEAGVTTVRAAGDRAAPPPSVVEETHIAPMAPWALAGLGIVAAAATRRGKPGR